jgi:hypothetical protein
MIDRLRHEAHEGGDIAVGGLAHRRRPGLDRLDRADEIERHRLLEHVREKLIAELRASLELFVNHLRLGVRSDQRFELAGVIGFHFAVHIGGQPDFQRKFLEILHGHALASCVPLIMAANLSRAVESLLITVPIGMPRMSAASL